MDGDRFDGIARSMASGTTRRRFLKGVGLGTVGVASVYAGDTSAAPKQVRMCVRGRGKTYTDKLISYLLVPLYQFLGLGFVPAPGAKCNEGCVPQSNDVTCAPTSANPLSRCLRTENNCGVLVDCPGCAEGHYCDDDGYCREGCGSDEDCATLADPCNAATCVHHQCAQTHINEGFKCDEPRSVCWEGWACKQGVCTELPPVTASRPCGFCMKCDWDGNCIPVPTGFDPWDDCDGLQYCKEGACVGCRDDSACAEGEYCRDGDCFAGCSTDDQCASFADACNTAACIENQCLPAPILDIPTEPGIPCTDPYYGYSGYCRDGACWPCLINEHCPAGQYCSSNNICNAGCRSDDECLDLADECNAGACIDGQCQAIAANDGADCPGGICQQGGCSGGD